jgi:hypothetical protein
MAHYAYIDENNIVIDVIVGPDEGTEPDGITSWEEYFSSKGKGLAIKTSYNTHAGVHYTTNDDGVRVPSDDQSKALRKNYAGIGFTYDEERDAFIPPQPFPSWTLNEETFLWEAPVAYPSEGLLYHWDEETTSWIEVTE